MFDIKKVLECPLCRMKLAKQLTCPKCGERYAYQNGVYVLINKKLSNREWAWDPELFTENTMKRNRERYQSYLNEETKIAQVLWWREMMKHSAGLHGLVCDLATGMGSLLSKLVKLKRRPTIIATDVDPNILAWTASKVRNPLSNQAGKRLIAVATDAKHMAFCDGIFDCFVSCEGLNNIPHTSEALQEMHRTLKSGGRIILMHTFVNKNSKSYKLAKGYFMDRALLEISFKADLVKSGYRKIQIHKVASAVWAKNPMDVIPVADDMQHFAIVTAET